MTGVRCRDQAQTLFHKLPCLCLVEGNIYRVGWRVIRVNVDFFDLATPHLILSGPEQFMQGVTVRVRYSSQKWCIGRERYVSSLARHSYGSTGIKCSCDLTY